MAIVCVLLLFLLVMVVVMVVMVVVVVVVWGGGRGVTRPCTKLMGTGRKTDAKGRKERKVVGRGGGGGEGNMERLLQNENFEFSKTGSDRNKQIFELIIIFQHRKPHTTKRQK